MNIQFVRKLTKPILKIPSSRIASYFSVSARREEEIVGLPTFPKSNEAERKNRRNPKGYSQFCVITASLLFRVSRGYTFIAASGANQNWLVSRSKLFSRWVLVTALLGLVLVPAGSLAAAMPSSDSAFENTGLLPTNPFYFLKTFTRNTQRIFTLNPIKKAELELDILDQKIKELARLQEISTDEESLKNAIDLYWKSLVNLQTNLQALKDTSKNPAVDKLLNKFLQISVRHAVLFQELEKSESTSLRESFERTSDKLDALVAETMNRLDSSDKLRDRLEAVADKQNDNLNLAPVLDRLNEKFSDDSYAKDVFSQFKEEILLSIQVALENTDASSTLLDNLGNYSSNPLPFISIFDQVRDRTSNSDLKNTLTLFRQKLLDAANDNRLVSKPEAEQAMNSANRMIKLVETRAIGVKSQPINTLLSRAKFNLTQANISFNANQYTEAFGQATASLVSAENAFSQLVYTGKGEASALSNEIKRLKNKYDNLVSKVNESGFTQEAMPELFDLILLSEKSLARVSDLFLDKTASFDKISAALHDAKLALVRAEKEFNNLFSDLQRAVESQKNTQSLIEQVLPANPEKEKELKKEAIKELQKR